MNPGCPGEVEHWQKCIPTVDESIQRWPQRRNLFLLLLSDTKAPHYSLVVMQCWEWVNPGKVPSEGGVSYVFWMVTECVTHRYIDKYCRSVSFKSPCVRSVIRSYTVGPFWTSGQISHAINSMQYILSLSILTLIHRNLFYQAMHTDFLICIAFNNRHIANNIGYILSNC